MVFFGFEGEGVDRDFCGGDVGVVLVRLDVGEVCTSTFSKSVVTVKLEFGNTRGKVSEGVRSSSTYPYEFLDGVVEVKLNLVVRTTSNSFLTSELELFNEVFVAELSETATFVSVKEDVVNPERGGAHGEGTSTERSFSVEFKIYLDFVVLEGNKGKSKPGVTAEPEFKRNVESSYCVLGKGSTNHSVVTGGLARGKGKFIPDVHPVTVLFVYALTTNFKFYILN